MRRRKQDYWMSCSIVLKDTKNKTRKSAAFGNKKNRNLYQRCGLGITC